MPRRLLTNCRLSTSICSFGFEADADHANGPAASLGALVRCRLLGCRTVLHCQARANRAGHAQEVVNELSSFHFDLLLRANAIICESRRGQPSRWTPA